MHKEVIVKHFEDVKEWATWLKKNYQADNSIDMLFYKKHTGQSGIEYVDALEIALCYGWIDGRIKRIDDDTYVRRFSRRSPESRWSLVNQKLMNKLLKENRVLPEVIAAYQKAKVEGLFISTAEKDDFKNRKATVPKELLKKLRESEKAEAFFKGLNERAQMAYSLYIGEAKKEETRRKRLDEMIKKLEAGWSMPYFRPGK